MKHKIALAVIDDLTKLSKKISAFNKDTDCIEIEDLKIGDDDFHLNIKQYDKSIVLTFTNHIGDFFIKVNANGKMTLARDIIRPNHDHDDVEYLTMHEKKKQDAVSWWSNHQYFDIPHTSHFPCEIEFGPKVVGY